jgi:hypothetical protein
MRDTRRISDFWRQCGHSFLRRCQVLIQTEQKRRSHSLHASGCCTMCLQIRQSKSSSRGERAYERSMSHYCRGSSLISA